jgi:hypothetical protein
MKIRILIIIIKVKKEFVLYRTEQLQLFKKYPTNYKVSQCFHILKEKKIHRACAKKLKQTTGIYAG